MKDQKLTVIFNNRISRDVYHMSLAGDCSEISRPGQFIDIQVDDFFLRRPISIFDYDDKHVEILYRIVGNGTASLADKVPGNELDVLLPLGNGFDVSRCGKKTLLVAGGIGMPPIHELAKEFALAQKQSNGFDAGRDLKVLVGFRSADDMFGLDSFRDIGVDTIVATEDGSYGIQGLVTDVMDMLKTHGIDDADDTDAVNDTDDTDDTTYDFDYVMCCGPEPMLKAVYDKSIEKHIAGGQFSFEERMGCGFGACMGCSCTTKYGYKRICKDGPVLDMEEILW